MAPLALVANLATRWHYLHEFQIWPQDGITCIAILSKIALLPSSPCTRWYLYNLSSSLIRKITFVRFWSIACEEEVESTQDGVKKWRPVSKCFRWIQQGVKLDFTIVCMLHHHFHPIRILLYHHFHPCRRLHCDHQFGLGFGVVIINVVIVINVVIIYLQLGFMKTLRWICVGVLSTPPHPNLASWYTLTLSSSSMLQSMAVGHFD